MSNFDFISYFVTDLSKVLHNDDFVVSYVYRDRDDDKPSLIIKPLVTDSDDAALCELKRLCVSSLSLGHTYNMSLEHLTLRRSACLDNGKIRLITLEVYELTMPNYQDYKEVVKRLEGLELDNNIYSLKSKKGGVKQ